MKQLYLVYQYCYIERLKNITESVVKWPTFETRSEALGVTLDRLV